MIASKASTHREPAFSEGIDTFREYGWVLAPTFFDAQQTRELLRYTAELEQMPEVSGAQMLYRERSLADAEVHVIQRIEDFCPHHAGFDALIRKGRLPAAVAALFGQPAVLFKDKINFKMPGGAGFEAHQDQQAGWTRYAPLFITAMVTIDATTAENGCLEIASVPRLSRMIGAEWEPLSADALTDLDLRQVPTLPGDVIFFDSFVPHASKPNFTDTARRVLYVTYNRAADGDQRARYFADKRIAFPPDIDRLPGTEYRFRV